MCFLCLGILKVFVRWMGSGNVLEEGYSFVALCTRWAFWLESDCLRAEILYMPSYETDNKYFLFDIAACL